MFQALNWLEIAHLVQYYRRRICGMFVERIIVPERKDNPDGFIKGEWAMRLIGGQEQRTVLFAVRAGRAPYFMLCPGRGPKASSTASRSPFDLALSKWLRGAKLIDLEALQNERTVVFWFNRPGSNSSKERLGLVLSLIPTKPEALLVSLQDWDRNRKMGWPVIARSKINITKIGEAVAIFTPPDGARAPVNLKIRDELLSNPDVIQKLVGDSLTEEVVAQRRGIIERRVRTSLKEAQTRLHSIEVSLKEATNEPDWQKFGDLLKSALHALPSRDQSGLCHVINLETGQVEAIPHDPRLSPVKQVEKFYQLAKRKHRRIAELTEQLVDTKSNLARYEKGLSQISHAGIGDIEFISDVPKQSRQLPGRTKNKGIATGKHLVSTDGFTILVGRNAKENMELTFKRARGNDIWMHVRGKPGAHVIIVLQPGKSAPLGTLLEAAALAIRHSGGSHWGKTEVDYTFRKYVKRIKDSTEVTYTHNKTLLVDALAADVLNKGL